MPRKIAPHIKPIVTSQPFNHARPPQTPDALHAWLDRTLGVRIARTPMVPGHSAPFDYLCHAFFEGRTDFGAPPDTPPHHAPLHTPRPAPDCIVWANRGGGKTYLGAIATLLDLLFKPRCQIRILAGSLEQGQRMHEHLRTMLDVPALAGVERRITARRIDVPSNNTRVEILAASQTSVRGTRVQKLRCDEVDLFDADLWAAAQLVTRSLPNRKGPWGETIRGSVEALSTMHRPHGLMYQLVGDPAPSPTATSLERSEGRTAMIAATTIEPLTPSRHGPAPSDPVAPALTPFGARTGARTNPRTIFRWGVLDVLERCEAHRDCAVCPLEPECRARAKSTPLASQGHIPIDDAVALKSRVGRETWETEMLCLRPSRSSSVYPEFNPAIHVRPCTPNRGPGASPGTRDATTTQPAAPSTQHFLSILAALDFGFRSESAVLLAGVTRSGALHIIREHCQREQTLDMQIDALERWRSEGLFRHRADPGDAPPLDFVAIDPAGNTADQHTGRTSAAVLRAHRFPVRSRGSEIYPGIVLVRDRLSPAWNPRAITVGALTSGRAATFGALTEGGAERQEWSNSPRLLIDPACPRLIECLTRYHFKDHAPDDPTPDKDGFDHACDALRYLVLNHDRRPSSQWSQYT